jgi:hypothetical protein
MIRKIGKNVDFINSQGRFNLFYVWFCGQSLIAAALRTPSLQLNE